MNGTPKPEVKMKQRVLWSSLAIAATFLVGAALAAKPLMRWWMHSRPFSAERFDPAKWKAGLAASQDGECVRGRMANDIISTIVVAGTPRQRVENILGPPQRAENGWTDYELGMCSGLRIDYDSLHVDYAEDKVVRAYHVQH